MIGNNTIGVITTIIDLQYKLKNRITRVPNDIFRTGNVTLLNRQKKYVTFVIVLGFR